MPAATVSCSGMVERIGAKDAILTTKLTPLSYQKRKRFPTHKIGLQKIVSYCWMQIKGGKT
jgi:hypothetical protein